MLVMTLVGFHQKSAERSVAQQALRAYRPAQCASSFKRAQRRPDGHRVRRGAGRSRIHGLGPTA